LTFDKVPVCYLILKTKLSCIVIISKIVIILHSIIIPCLSILVKKVISISLISLNNRLISLLIISPHKFSMLQIIVIMSICWQCSYVLLRLLSQILPLFHPRFIFIFFILHFFVLQLCNQLLIRKYPFL
jgi:hypothetical protein